jgi:recombination protein RecR
VAAPESLEALMAELERLPGIGPRNASRLAHHLLRVPEEQALALAEAIRAVRERIRPCSLCRAPAESDPCPLCASESRDRSLLLVVETPRDLTAFEAAGSYRGLYYVLGARLSPLDGVDEAELNFEGLRDRVARPEVREVCLGTNPNLEGDGTALALMELLHSVGEASGGEASGDRTAPIRITRLARGLPTGGQIEYQNASVIADAFEGRLSAE